MSHEMNYGDGDILDYLETDISCVNCKSPVEVQRIRFDGTLDIGYVARCSCTESTKAFTTKRDSVNHWKEQ